MIRVGIGGWSFEPWRETFYPKSVAKKCELAYASSKLTAIEINATFYRTQSATTFAKWAAETPSGFMFSVKGPQAAVMKRDLRESGEAVQWFLNSGVTELGDKLGPLFWQLAPTKKFNAEEIAGFLAHLPPEHLKRKLRHCIEVRGPTFATAEFYELARQRNVAIVFVDSEKHAQIDEPTSDFAYARLQKTQADEPTGYKPAAIKGWAKRAKEWEAQGKGKRDVFMYFISGAKERAPAAAMELLKVLK